MIIPSKNLRNISYNKSIIEDEINRDFIVDCVSSNLIGKNAFFGMIVNLSCNGQQTILNFKKNSADVFVVNANPSSDKFGEHCKFMMWENHSIYIPEFHLFGVCTHNSNVLVQMITGNRNTVGNFHKIDILKLQENNEKFSTFNFGGIKDVTNENFVNIDEFSISKIKGIIENDI